LHVRACICRSGLVFAGFGFIFASMGLHLRVLVCICTSGLYLRVWACICRSALVFLVWPHICISGLAFAILGLDLQVCVCIYTILHGRACTCRSGHVFANSGLVFAGLGSDLQVWARICTAANGCAFI
jgi:hypothetical protein